MALPNEAAPVVDRARRCGLSPCRLSIGAAYGAQLSTSAAPMCRLCCRCELYSLKRRTINSTTPCVLASSLTLRIFPAHPILYIRWNLFNAPTLSLLLFAPLIWFTHGEIGSVGSAGGILSGPSSHSILSSVFTPCPFHHPDIRLSTLPHLWYVLILSHLTRHIPPLAFSSCCHPSLYPTDEGGKGGGEKKKHRYHFSRTNYTPFSFIV